VRCAALVLLVGCGGSSTGSPDPDSAPADSAIPDVMHLDKSAGCVSNFGNALSNGHGRLDGIVVAVLAPGNTSCPRPNDDHLILEVRTGGQVYRMVAAVESTFGEPKMAFASKDAALVGPAWADGWHLDVDFDYVTDLDLHRLDFAPMPMFDLADAITGPIAIGREDLGVRDGGELRRQRAPDPPQRGQPRRRLRDRSRRQPDVPGHAVRQPAVLTIVRATGLTVC
jgi:hypothetical protein